MIEKGLWKVIRSFAVLKEEILNSFIILTSLCLPFSIKLSVVPVRGRALFRMVDADLALIEN